MKRKVILTVLLGLLAFVNAQQPVVLPSTNNIAPTADITISGRFFSPTASSNSLALSPSGSCTVVYGSISTLICRPAAALAVGPLYLSAISSNGIPNAYNPPIQIATIVPAPTVVGVLPGAGPIIIGRINTLNITGTNFNHSKISVDLTSGSGFSPCVIVASNSTNIECRPQDDSNFEAGSIYATVRALDTVVSNTAPIATVLPMIEEPIGGNYSIGRPPFNVPSLPVVASNVTIFGRYLSRNTASISVSMALGPVRGTCASVIAATARSVTCTLGGGAFSSLGPVVAQINVTLGPGAVLPGIPNLAAFVIPRVNAPASPLTVVSAFNISGGSLQFSGIGFGPLKENNTVLLYGLVAAYRGDPAYLCTTTRANSTHISCDLPPYLIAGTYGASVIVGPSAAGPLGPAVLVVNPIVTSANASTCCIEDRYTAILIEGAGFSINATEQSVEISDVRFPNVTKCLTRDPSFPGLSSIGNGKMLCLLDIDLNDIEYLENVTVTVRGQRSNTFRIKGLKKEIGDKQILAISIVGPLVAVGVLALIAGFVWNSSWARERRNRNKPQKTYQPLAYRSAGVEVASTTRNRSKSKGKRPAADALDEAPSTAEPPAYSSSIYGESASVTSSFAPPRSPLAPAYGPPIDPPPMPRAVREIQASESSTRSRSKSKSKKRETVEEEPQPQHQQQEQEVPVERPTAPPPMTPPKPQTLIERPGPPSTRALPMPGSLPPVSPRGPSPLMALNGERPTSPRGLPPVPVAIIEPPSSPRAGLQPSMSARSIPGGVPPPTPQRPPNAHL